MWTRARSECLPGGAKIILTPLIGVPNAQFTLPAIYDKTFLSDCSERVQTSDFLSVGDSLELSGIQFTPYRSGHDTDKTVLSSGVVVWITERRQRRLLALGWVAEGEGRKPASLEIFRVAR